MLSDFRKKKLLHVFNTFFDSDQSGSVTKEDFDLGFSKICELRSWKEGEDAYEEMKLIVAAMWEGMQEQADNDGDGEITTEEWITLWSEFDKNPEDEAEWQALYCQFFFRVTDMNSNNKIDVDEFATTYKYYGLDKADSAEAFKKMSGGKEEIDWSEFQAFWREYFATEDENAPGNYIFGKVR